jgi:hypothetical protein
LDLDVTPNAVQLLKAIRECTETISLSMTSTGRLAVRSGRFKAFIECYPGGFPEIRPSGKRIEVPADFLDALKMLAPCIAEDASRPWARGILLRGKSAFATNNIVLAEYFLGSEWPLAMNIPADAVAELLRIGEVPEALMAEEKAVTFLFSGGRWLRTQLYTTEWPDVEKALSMATPTEPHPLPFPAEALAPLTSFLDDAGRVHFGDGVLTTHLDSGIGAQVEVPGLSAGGIFNHHMLGLALESAKTIAFLGARAYFFSDKLRGVIIGMRP